MPGVKVTTATRSGPTPIGDATSATFFVAGITERGPIVAADAPLLRSMADYVRHYGDRVSYGSVYDSVKTFFEEGGTRARVARAVGAANTVGTLSLLDRHAVTPVPTLTINALGPGAWSTGVTVEVRDGTQANTFDLVVRHGNATETYTNLTNPADAVAALETSAFVRAVDAGSATVAPLNNPAVLAATALSAGNDDRAAVDATTLIAALDTFGPGYGDGCVAIPGQAAATVAAGIDAHCEANNRIGLLAVTEGASVQDALNQAATVRAATSNDEYLGIFYPWVRIPDEGGRGGTFTVSPEGYVAACRARAHIETGPERAPGGLIAQARYVVGPETELTSTEGDQLDDNEVNVIRVIAGTTRLYGWRSLSSDEANYALLTGRDLLNSIVVEGERRLEQYVFRTVDSRGLLFAEIEAEMVGMVEPIAARGGLYPAFDDEGNELDPGYSTDTGPSVNTAARLLANEASAAIAVRISPVAAMINLFITKVGLLASV